MSNGPKKLYMGKKFQFEKKKINKIKIIWTQFLEFKNKLYNNKFN